MRLLIPLFAFVAVRPEGGGCNAPAAHDGRVGIAGHAIGEGVYVDEIGVGTPADGRIEPGEVIVAVDGVELWGPRAFVDLRDLAAGEPGTEVALEVTGEAGPREVVLTRAVFSDDIARRHTPLWGAHERPSCSPGGAR